MSKGQRGNKEAKKPKKAVVPQKAPGTGESMPTLVPATPPRARR
jgi:hypothetical protein